MRRSWDAADEAAALSGECCPGGGAGDCAERVEGAGGVIVLQRSGEVKKKFFCIADYLFPAESLCNTSSMFSSVISQYNRCIFSRITLSDNCEKSKPVNLSRTTLE